MPTQISGTGVRTKRNAALTAFDRIRSQASRRKNTKGTTTDTGTPNPSENATESPPQQVTQVTPSQPSDHTDQPSDDDPEATSAKTPQEDHNEDTSEAADADGDADAKEEQEDNEDKEENEDDDDDDDDEEEADDTDTSKEPGETGMGQVRFEESYASVVQHPADPSQATQYQQRRLALMISIPEVDNNADRLYHIVVEVNNFMKMARKKVPNFRLRKFNDISPPDATSRKKWRTKMNQDSSADFREYIQGYYPFTPPRGGAYRLRINTVMDANVPLPTFLENVTHDWGQKDSRAISDIKAQRIWDPVKVGYLMRASRYMTHSYELVDAFERAANRMNSANPIYFGISWGTIPSPVGGYDKDTAVQGVMIETNKDTLEAAVAILQKWYPLNPATPSRPPFQGNFRFVLNRDNVRVKGNPVALSNLSILMERQGIFNSDTKGEQSFCLRDVNMPYKGGRSISVREKLLQTKVHTLHDDLKGSPLFLSISTAVNNRSGNKSVWFTYHHKVESEAVSVIRNLPSFFAAEWKINPEYVCYSHFINPSDSWDPVQRVANNEDTEAIRLACEIYTTDLHRVTEPAATDTDDNASMTSKAQREMRRMMENDSETVTSVSKEKQFNPRPASIIIAEDASHGGVSAVSGTSSRSSVIRAKMQQEFDAKLLEQRNMVSQLRQEKDDQQKQMSAMAAQLAQLQSMLQNLQPTQSKVPIHAKAPLPPLPPSPPRVSSVLACEQDEPPEEPEFDPSTSAVDQADLIAEIEDKITAKLDREPTPEEVISIRIEAHRILSQMDMDDAVDPETDTVHSDDPEDIKSPVRSKMRRSFADSDEDTDSDAKDNTPSLGSKRIALTPSDDASASDHHFAASASTSPKKKHQATGGASPMVDD